MKTAPTAIVASLAATGLSVFLTANVYQEYGNEREITCTVTETKLLNDAEPGMADYAISTEECGTLYVDGGEKWDDWFPSALTPILTLGDPYVFTVTGWDILPPLMHNTVQDIAKPSGEAL